MSNLSTILSSMSSAFNNSEKTKVVSLEQDSTLKWRGLLNNTYASKDAKHMRNRNENPKSAGENSSSSSSVDTTTAVAAAADICSSTKVDVATETESKAEQKQENICENSEKTLRADAETAENHTENHDLASSTQHEMTSKPSTTTDKTNNDKTPATSPQDKKSSKGSKATRNVLDVRSDRSLRSKGTPRSESSETPSKKTDEAEKSEEPKNEGTPLAAKRGRGRKKKIDTESPQTETKIETESTEAKPRITLTIRQNRSTNPVVIPSSLEPPKKVEPVIVVKKRGRRSKQSLQAEKLLNPDQTTPQILTRSAHKDDSGATKRPLRRIRPTAKILASDELREGFVQQNCARLNITDEEIQHMEQTEEAGKQRQTREIVKRRGATKDEKSENVKQSTSPQDSVDSTDIKRSLSFSDTSSSSKISYSSIQAPPAPKICPDPADFLREIRNAKLALPKSPEDNKKLNKKQVKRLMKMKEKHFFLLGLKKNRGHKVSDSEDGSDECDEFVPTRKVMSVGKPGVTLRLRNFRKEHEQAAKRRGSPLQVPGRKRRVKEHEMEQRKRHQATPQDAVVSSNQPNLVPASITNPTSNHRQMSLPAMEQPQEIIDVDEMNLICLCLQTSNYFLQRTDAMRHCCAIDDVEGQKIGCTNELHGDLLQLLRPSLRTSYMVLCESHKKRLVSHNCCAGCGVFLTQGIFSLCPNKHFFHRDCTVKCVLNAPHDPNSPHFTLPTLAFQCPHCGVDVPDSSFRVTMKSENVPVFFTNQKHHIHRAKMTITNKPSVSSNSFALNIERLVPESVLEALQRASTKLKTHPPKVFTPRDFCNAIYNSVNIEKVAEIIASGFELTKPFKEFQNGTCLHLVSNFGNVTILYMVLCRIASKDFINVLDKERRTAVMCAVVGRKNEILKVLVQFGADLTLKGPDGMTALHLAAKTGNFPAAQIILDYFRQSASQSRTEEYLNMTDNGKWTALVWAAENGYAEIVSYFISLGADVNICDHHNNTVLHWAALSGKIETIYPLMLPNTLYNTQNINGDTALHIACRQSNTRICLVLVANGANLYTRNDAGEIPFDCIPDETSQCARVLQFNMEMRNLGNYRERKVLCHDISNGRELYPVQMVQRLSNAETLIMSDFKYITKNIIIQSAVQIDTRISQMRVCSCSDSCINENCQCGQISIQNWYNSQGQLINEFNYDDPAMIFECSDVCGCNLSLCKNRVVQQGTKIPMQVFECDDPVRGFGVRTLVKIPKGTFITEYIGEILTDAEADRRTDDSFFFYASEHCLDAKFYGNVSRFFNHSCDANIAPIRVYYGHQDTRFPKIAFFASRDIEPEEELTFDYGTKFWLAKYKQFTCHCNSSKCHYSSATIMKTLEEYNQRNPNN
ncbi:histone-lysine N-methyltransferase EHMT2 [Culicoides brevitarsis]|uniref:histone-lysine N-methyltransferase EHMT2 n=1 Tax=Culicoides brevitarsis TaxID=469753 RepID=UPI00307CA8C1